MSIGLRVILMIAFLSLASCTVVGGQGTSQPAVSSPEMVALAASQAHLERYLGRELTAMQVDYGPAQWTDTSLGCPQEGSAYEEKLIAGYEFELAVDGLVFELHASENGTTVVFCGIQPDATALEPAAAETPTEIERPLRTARSLLAGALGISADAIALESITWRALTFPDSGLGCAEPDVPVLEVLTEGYSFQITYRGHTYKIHTDLTGDLGVLCGESRPAVADGADAPMEQEEAIPEAVRAAADKARQLVAQELGADAEALALEDISWQEAVFPSSALGCPEPGVEYTEAETSGYIFSLALAGVNVEVHTDRLGERGTMCIGAEPQTEASAVQSETRIVFTSYAHESLGFGISYPIDWQVKPSDSEAEIVFSPHVASPALGMSVVGLDEAGKGTAILLSEYQLALLAVDATATLRGDPERIGPLGWSQLYNREIDGVTVLERVSFMGNGYRVLQWAPEGQWLTWKELFVQMLRSMVLLSGTGG